MKLQNLIPARLRRNTITIPIVRLSGVIAAANSPISRNLNLANVAPSLEKAFEMKRAPAVGLVINSPGGSPVQSRLIFSRIRELADKHEKKVLVFVEDVAASGGYMIALAGDEIIADETSIIGSIGVVSASFGFNKAIEKIGVERRVYTAGKNKVSLDPFLPENDKDIEYLKKLQLEIHDVFIEMVKHSRGEKLSDDDELFTGRFWTGAMAKKLGLIDDLGHLSIILKQRYGEKTKLRLIQARKGLFGRGGASGIYQSGRENNTKLANGVGEALVDRAADRLEERAIWSRFGL